MLRSVLVFMIAAASAVPLSARAGSGSVPEELRKASMQVMEVSVPSQLGTPAADEPVQVGSVNITSTTVETVSDFVGHLPENRDLVVSFDSGEVADKIIAARKGASGLTRLIPFGSRLMNKSKEFANHLIKSASEDRIGLMIMMVNTSYDSYVWLHAYQHSEGVRAAQAIYTTLLAVTFSVDKDLWATTARKIQGGIVRIFDPAIMDVSEMKDMNARLLSSFIANFMLGMGVQTGRLAILSFDRVVDLPFILQAAGTSMLLGTALTLANFGWTEFSANVDGDKSPFAKWVVRRFSELRSFTLGYLAPSSKLLQPESYGATPWVALGVSTATGLSAFVKTDRLVNWIEKIPSLRAIKKPLGNLRAAFTNFAEATGMKYTARDKELLATVGYDSYSLQLRCEAFFSK